MSKVYFVVSKREGKIVGVAANGSGRAITQDETGWLIDTLRASDASITLIDALRDGSYPNAVSVFDKRKDARDMQLDLRKCDSPFSWSVLEVGEKLTRNIRPILGWRVMFDTDEISCWNAVDSGADVYIDGNRDNNYEDNLLFSTRKAARTVVANTGDARSKANPQGYFVVPVYAHE